MIDQGPADLVVADQVGQAVGAEQEAVAVGQIESVDLGDAPAAGAAEVVRQHVPQATCRRRVGRQLAGIDEHLGDDLRLERLADVAGVDRHHFSRAFKKATGVPPHRYVMERRVERATELLTRSELPIAQIAHDVGMSSQSHLTTVFRRVVGDTPLGYRKARRGA